MTQNAYKFDASQNEFSITIPGGRLQNFEIRVGNDEQIGNNAICYKQLEQMASGVTKKFPCSSEILGHWVSLNKTGSGMMGPLHIQEVRVYGGKCVKHLEINLFV